MLTGCRYTRAIKQSLNKAFNNKSSLNFSIAGIIAEFSHKSLVTKGSKLKSSYGFFIVTKILSQNWCKGFFCPPRMVLPNIILPNFSIRTQIQKKRLFDHFANTNVRWRYRSFHLDDKHESLPNICELLAGS